MEQPPAVPKGRRAHLQPQLRRHLPQAALPSEVGGQLLAQLRGGGVEQLRQLGILAAHGAPALPHPGVILPPVQQGGQLPVHRRHIGGEVEAPVRKIPGEVLRQGAAPGHHGGGGVVHGVEGGGIVLLPAPVPQGAAPAQLSGGPVKDDGHVVVVPGRAKGGPQGLGQGPEGGGGRLQLSLDQALSPQISRAGQLRGQPGPQHPQAPLRQGEKNQGGQRPLIQAGQGQPPAPGPQQCGGVGPGKGQGGSGAALSPDSTGGQSPQGIGHGVHWGGVGPQVHGRPQHRPQDRPRGAARLAGGGEYGQSGQAPAHGDVLDQMQGSQRQQHRGRQHQQPRPSGGGREPVLPPGAQGSQGQGIAPAGPHGEGGLQSEGDHPRGRPARLAADDDPSSGVDGSGDEGHGPGLAEGLPVVKGEGHGKGQGGGGGAPQPLGQLQQTDRAQAGPGQGGHPPQAGARRPHKGHPEGGAVPQQHRPGQHGGEQKVDARLGPQCHGGGGQAHLPRLSGPQAQLEQFGADGLFGSHSPSPPVCPAWAGLV